MIGQLDRQLVAQLLIVAGACIGTWLLVVEPRQRELKQLRTQINTCESSSGVLDPAAYAARSQAIAQAVTSVQDRNAISADSAMLYGNIMSLAREAGVSVQNVRPGSDERTNAVPSPIKVNRLEIVIDGTFAQVGDFLDSLGQLSGYLRPAALTITPLLRDGQQLVTARIVYEAVAFTIPEPLVSMSKGERHDGQP